MTQYTQEQIIEIASLPVTAFKFKTHVDTLVDFYRWIRAQWVQSAQNELKHKYKLDLRTKTDRLKFAWYAAKELAQDCLPSFKPETSDSSIHPKGEVNTTKILCQAIALLPPLRPTNSLENAPAYRVLGSPISADELVRNYKILAQKWHPDRNPSLEAIGRFQLITNIYKTLRSQWFTKYSPLISKDKIGDRPIRLAYAVKLPYPPESFWV